MKIKTFDVRLAEDIAAGRRSTVERKKSWQEERAEFLAKPEAERLAIIGKALEGVDQSKSLAAFNAITRLNEESASAEPEAAKIVAMYFEGATLEDICKDYGSLGILLIWVMHLCEIKTEEKARKLKARMAVEQRHQSALEKRLKAWTCYLYCGPWPSKDQCADAIYRWLRIKRDTARDYLKGLMTPDKPKP
jgi:hypothetical protein